MSYQNPEPMLYAAYKLDAPPPAAADRLSRSALMEPRLSRPDFDAARER